MFRRRQSLSAVERRVKTLPTHTLLPGLQNALYGSGRAVTDFQRHPSAPALDELVRGLEHAVVFAREIRERHKDVPFAPDVDPHLEKLLKRYQA